jgi:hypothetical protein
MDGEPSARLERVIEARRRQLSEQQAHRSHRAERDRIVAEIPRLLAKLTGAVGEINDQLSETDVVLALTPHDRQYAAESSFRVGITDQDSTDAYLDIAIERSGRVHALIGRDGHKRGLAEADLFSVSRETMIDWLVDLLETRYLN